MNVRSIAELRTALQPLIEKAMEEYVGPVVRDTMKDMIVQEVYSVYEPKEYERQMEFGGLLDDDNITIINMENGVMVSSSRVDLETGKSVSWTVETGIGYDYLFPFYGKPRPFTQATRDELKRSGKHIEALRRGLSASGLNVQKS